MKKGRSDKRHDCYAEEPLNYSVYFGRERLGRFIRSGEQEFLAFDRDDRTLGTFRKQKQAVHAIYAAADERR